MLDKGWKFHAGDDSQWANPNIDDNNWENLNPNIDIHYLVKQKENAGIGWFRLKINVDSSLQDSSLALVISQVVASEIYLNGKLIYRSGTVSNDYRKEQAYTLRDRPFIIHFPRQNLQELAVRYSFSSRKFITLFDTNPCASLTLKSSNLSFTNFASTSALGYIIIGIIATYLTLCLFCFYFFISFRNEKAYLFVSVNSLGQVISLLLYSFLSAIKSITLASFLFILSNTLSSICLIFLLNAFYLFFNRSKPWYYKFFLIYLLLAVPISFISYTSARILMAGFGAVISLELILSTIKAISRKRPGTAIVLTGISLAFLCGIGNVYSVIAGEFVKAGYYVAIMFIISPLVSTFFIAGEFARASLTLQKKAREVKELSDKTISQEQEKQQILATQNEKLEIEVQNRTAALNRYLQELKSTQAQLIQSEKMASLGELTAGIAHEIQNPLNFVNNFSEVSIELADELKQEINKINVSETEKENIESIMDDLVQNQQKINQHGKRADAIVKSMLQHSRVSTGQKELTDINALADEYLRLSYHGLRAKDKSFNATLQTNFDKTVEKINVIPQDIGRVLLNLFNNAFYAVSERQKVEGIRRKGEGEQTLNPNYEPTVSVCTKKADGKIEIHVKDNGNGVPQKVLDKIFQPFFTTKPAGEGTGLGLSLSYDIIKAHGGDIKVITEEGEGAEFLIQLPV